MEKTGSDLQYLLREVHTDPGAVLGQHDGYRERVVYSGLCLWSWVVDEWDTEAETWEGLAVCIGFDSGDDYES